MDDASEISASLELCAERAGDIVPAVFERFFAADQDAATLMAHSDRHMQGRMFESVVELFLSDSHFGSGNYLDWELDNHLVAYSATPAMYRSFFASLIEVVKAALGMDWTAEHDRAWTERITKIMEQVDAHWADQIKQSGA